MESVKLIYVRVLVFIPSDLISSSVLGVKSALPKQCSWNFLKLSDVDSYLSEVLLTVFVLLVFLSSAILIHPNAQVEISEVGGRVACSELQPETPEI